MSGIERFNDSAARLVDLHGDDATVKVIDPQGEHDLGSGEVVVDPRSFTTGCTIPVSYAPGLVDGQRIQAGDCAVFIQRGAPEVAFEPAPGMLAEVSEPDLAPRQFEIVNAPRLAGAYELQLRGGTD